MVETASVSGLVKMVQFRPDHGRPGKAVPAGQSW